MKYVILTPKPGVSDQLRLLFCCAPTKHAELAAPYAATHEPTSAGFLEFLDGGKVATFGRSDTLHLGPRLSDAELISSFIRGTQSMARDTERAGRAATGG